MANKEFNEKYAKVQIVPLWNWNKENRKAYENAAFRSNCTFMELKCALDKFIVHHIAFKLYLYGIEISANLQKFLLAYSSNCTFMELKYR